MLVSSFRAKAAGLVLAVFSWHASGQEVVVPGSRIAPHQPPGWFARMAPPVRDLEALDSFIAKEPDRGWFGKVPERTGITYFCGVEKGDEGVKWKFCDM